MISCDEAESNEVKDPCATIIIKRENTSGYCYCCLTEIDLKSLCSIHHYEGKPEVYSEMLFYCFSIQLLPADNVDSETFNKICEACIYRLREACSFKNQIETAQESLEKLSDLSKRNLKKEQYESDSDTDFLKTEISCIYSPNGGNGGEELSNKLTPKKILSNKDSAFSKRQKKIKNKKLKNNVSTQVKFKHLKTECSLSKKNNEIAEKPFKETKYDHKPYILTKDEKTCKICNESFPLHSSLVRHMPIHFPNHICDICAKIFDSLRNLRRHISRHKPTKMACDICHKVYKGRENLRIHMRLHNINPSTTSYSCPHCPERFSVYYKRIKHLVEVHNDEPKKYKCNQCHKGYSQACALKSHIKRVHLQERSCICSECGNAFFDKAGLNEHMLKHNGVKNFQCDICQKSYGRRYTLKQHMRTHTNDKRFTCTFCGRSFTQKCTLKGHLKTHGK